MHRKSIKFFLKRISICLRYMNISSGKQNVTRPGLCETTDHLICILCFLLLMYRLNPNSSEDFPRVPQHVTTNGIATTSGHHVISCDCKLTLKSDESIYLHLQILTGREIYQHKKSVSH